MIIYDRTIRTGERGKIEAVQYRALGPDDTGQVYAIVNGSAVANFEPGHLDDVIRVLTELRDARSALTKARDEMNRPGSLAA